MSFKLEAGAICAIKFSNRHQSSNLVNKTLNISSTGAKTLTGTSQGASSQLDGGWGGIVSSAWLFWYNGSTYSFMGDYWRSAYSDAD